MNMRRLELKTLRYTLKPCNIALLIKIFVVRFSVDKFDLILSKLGF